MKGYEPGPAPSPMMTTCVAYLGCILLGMMKSDVDEAEELGLYDEKKLDRMTILLDETICIK
jgi:hypothetical protein